MKHGLKPTRKQKLLLKKYGKNPTQWLITKAPPGELHITHRDTGKELVLKIS